MSSRLTVGDLTFRDAFKLMKTFLLCEFVIACGYLIFKAPALLIGETAIKDIEGSPITKVISWGILVTLAAQALPQILAEVGAASSRLGETVAKFSLLRRILLVSACVGAIWVCSNIDSGYVSAIVWFLLVPLGVVYEEAVKILRDREQSQVESVQLLESNSQSPSTSTQA